MLPDPAEPETARACAQAVAILGMHRSGTSCLAGALQRRGLQLGEVVTEVWDNPRGNREDLELRHLNNALLAASGGTWRRPPDAVQWDADLAARRDALLEVRRGRGRWGFKDPRTVLTLPFWREALPNLRLVGTIRSPAAVASSLIRRQEEERRRGLRANPAPLFTPAEALDLWKAYNQRLLDLATREGFPLVCYDWPAERYLRAVDDAATRLGLGALPSGASDFFEEGLRGRFGGGDLPVPEEYTQLYRQLVAHAEGRSSGTGPGVQV